MSGERISDKKYQNVLNIGNKMEIKKCDILFLVHVFGKFRNRCQENYGLFSSHYLSAPALSCDAMLSKLIL